MIVKGGQCVERADYTIKRNNTLGFAVHTRTDPGTLEIQMCCVLTHKRIIFNYVI